ncbi:MAG: hypothetical protein E3J50_01750 [Dehalococcoidia bacterium]|nr:MAG: hypothetical protein E3J50_01750 [Dehalococcoidia bacterium]
MAKKQKRAIPKPAPTKRQLSKWQRQMRMRRIVIIAAAVFLAGLVSWVGYGVYNDRVAPWREVVISVNNVSFTMGYYVDMLDAYAGEETDPYFINYMAGIVADTIIDVEVMRQQAKKELGIEVSRQEIEAELEERGLPDDKVYRDIIGSLLLEEKLRDYFDSQLPDGMEQAHVQVMLVESEEVADAVMTAIQAGGNFTALVDEFSCHPETKGDLGWLPRELMPNTVIGEAAFNITVGDIGEPIYDELATKSIGYWLIEIDAINEESDEIEVKARAMLLGNRAEAERIRAQLVGGNFTSLAKQHSQHESKTGGGELGWLKEGDMGSEAFDEVAFNLTPNEVSEPVRDESVQTIAGYWILEVIDRDDARELEGEAREALTEKDLIASFEKWKEESRIENLLDLDKQNWAISEVLRRR